MRKLMILGLLAAVVTAVGALMATRAGANPPQANGRIAFARFDPNLGDTVIYTINPDGSHEQRLTPGTGECPQWSPDGTRIATCGGDGAVTIWNPDTSASVALPMQDPTLFTAGSTWSPDQQRFALEGIDFTSAGGDRTGIYTVRSSDGGGLTQLTSNPGGDDQAKDYSPNGRRLVFQRFYPDGSSAIFVINTNSTGLKQITPPGMLVLQDAGVDWSQQGNEIVFAAQPANGLAATLWVVHSNGSGLHQIPGTACGGAFSDPNFNFCLQPAWSPDGKKIVFSRFNSATSQRNLYTVNTNGSGLFQVTHGISTVRGEGDEWPDWGTHPLIGG